MRVLFIFPNTANRPLISMATPILMGRAKNKGWEISYFDTSNYEKDRDSVQDKELTGEFLPRPNDVRIFIKPFDSIPVDLQEKIDTLKPDIIAISAMTCDYEFLMKFWPDINTHGSLRLIGGFHATVLPEEILSTNLFDIVCMGRAEDTFEEILDACQSKKSFYEINGICFKDGSKTVITEKRYLLKHDEVWAVDPDYDSFDTPYFTFPFDGKNIKMCQVESSRGCPYNCSYCGNAVMRNYYKGYGKFLIVRPFDSLFKLVKRMIKDFNIEIFSFTDECFMGRSTSWLEEFCARWKEIKRPFLIQTRPEFVTEDTLKILISSDAPFIQIGMGVESGSKRILEEICDRHVKNEETIKAYDLMHKYSQFRSNAFFMLGFPTETREEIFETIRLCKRLKSKVNSIAIFQPFPGQRLRDFCIQNKILKVDDKMSSFTGESVLSQSHISSQEISNLRRCFLLYSKLPESYYGDIEKCEKDFENNKALFKQLVDKRWALEL